MNLDTSLGSAQNPEITPEMRDAVLRQVAEEARQKRLNQLAEARKVRARRREQNRDRMLAQLAAARQVRSIKAAQRRVSSGKPSTGIKTGTHGISIPETLAEVSRISARGNITESAHLYQQLREVADQLAKTSAQLAAIALLNQSQSQ